MEAAPCSAVRGARLPPMRPPADALTVWPSCEVRSARLEMKELRGALGGGGGGKRAADGGGARDSGGLVNAGVL